MAENTNDIWPLFIISLADAKERQKSVLSKFHALGFEPELIKAVDGRKGLPAEFEQLIDRDATKVNIGRLMSDGEYGCALSHRSLWQKIVDEDLPGAIILEDDAIPSLKFSEFVNGRGYLAADLVQMDHLDARVWWRKRRFWSSGIVLAPLACNASLTTGYSLSSRAAHYLCEHSKPLSGLADWPCDVLPLGPVVTLPRLIDHPELEVSSSTLEVERNALRSGETSLRYKRFLNANYWHRWWLKRRARKVS